MAKAMYCEDTLSLQFKWKDEINSYGYIFQGFSHRNTGSEHCDIDIGWLSVSSVNQQAEISFRNC